MTGDAVAQVIVALAGLITAYIGARGVSKARENRRQISADRRAAAARIEEHEARAKQAAVEAAVAPVRAAMEAQSRLIDGLNVRIDDLEGQLAAERVEANRKIARLEARIIEGRYGE